jgi:hypothetical protein
VFGQLARIARSTRPMGQVNMLDARKRHTEECLEAKDQEKYEGDEMQKIKDSFKP